MPAWHTAYIAVGSNLGRRLRNCRRGIDRLAATSGVRAMALSPFYRTEPMDVTDQEWFVNAVACIATHLSPQALLRRMLEIERELGRPARHVRYGPRTLDLDVLLYGDRRVTTTTLTIPHPRMHLRRFVLVPLCDIAPALRHPVLGETVDALLHSCPTEGQALFPVASIDES